MALRTTEVREKWAALQADCSPGGQTQAGRFKLAWMERVSAAEVDCWSTDGLGSGETMLWTIV